jgi:hypothetical protein
VFQINVDGCADKFFLFVLGRQQFFWNCLQFYVRLELESPLDKRQIMEDRLSSGTGNMPQTWLRWPCL